MFFSHPYLECTSDSLFIRIQKSDIYSLLCAAPYIIFHFAIWLYKINLGAPSLLQLS